MNRPRAGAAWAALVLALPAGALWAGDWTKPVEVRHDLKLVVSYRARLNGDFLMVEVKPETPWHTFSMDNKQRAQEKLAGKPALGVDAPTEIGLSTGLAAAGPWHQTPPKDFSQPELQLFTFGYDGPAQFVTKVKRSGAGTATVAIKGQACTPQVCKQIDVDIPLPLAGAERGATPVDLKTLVQVRN